jgi:arylsulfatase A-like enzyme
MLPSLLSRPDLQEQHDYLYWEFGERGGAQAIREGNFKAVRVNVKRNPEAPIELYDLNRDPGETTDISAQNPDVVKRMAALFKEARVESDIFRLFPGK